MTLSSGYAVMPEQSTVAIIAHHPQAVYFGMKSGRLPAETSPDTIIHDPRRRVGHRATDNAVFFDDEADAYEESREEAVEDNDPQGGDANGRVGEATGELDPA